MTINFRTNKLLSEEDQLLQAFIQAIKESNVYYSPATVYAEGKIFDIMQPVSNRYFLFKVKNQDAEIIFQDPLEINIEKEENLFFVENHELNIFGHGEMKDEALQDFSNFFIFDYLSYKNTPEEKLSNSARKLIAKYDKYVKEVKRYESTSKG